MTTVIECRPTGTERTTAGLKALKIRRLGAGSSGN
jgi:hypothetical protein